ncbi:MAG: winged helix-turn-helix transcriptional regulator [Spirochaetales bacterium]|nr:winged helix-turn-helix transcriptional regulator [Spirochaetales bacterium]
MNYEDVSVLLKALGHPIRLRIVKGLIECKCCVNEISGKLDTPQSTISQHLTVLRNAGIITPRKEGVKTCYFVTNTLVEQMMELLASMNLNE